MKNFRDSPGKLYLINKKCPKKTGKKVSKKMNKEQKFVTVLQGKSVREFAQRLVNSSYRIEQQSLNRYRVYEAQGNDYTLINRRSFVVLDKELYRLQVRQNPLAFAIEKALDNDALTFCIDKASVDKMPVKLLVKTLSSAKVRLEHVSRQLDNYIIKLSLIESVSERALTANEKDIAAMFQRANANENAGNPETETPTLPPPETTAVDPTAKEIPAK